MTDFDPMDAAADLLTFDDIIEIEELAGQSLAGLEGGQPIGRLTKAMSFVLGRKLDPDLTWDDAGKWSPSKLEEIVERLGAPKAVQPDSSGGDG